MNRVTISIIADLTPAQTAYWKEKVMQALVDNMGAAIKDKNAERLRIVAKGFAEVPLKMETKSANWIERKVLERENKRLKEVS